MFLSAHEKLENAELFDSPDKDGAQYLLEDEHFEVV